MNKHEADPKVKKTLLRNYEQKVKLSQAQVVQDLASSSKLAYETSQSSRENKLSQPTLCSTEALANYLSDIKGSLPPPHSVKNSNVDKDIIKSKVTKKLNFHFNDKIYKNLIELNANVDDIKNIKNNRPSHGTTSIKRDLEPNIEDFHENDKVIDTPPTIPIHKLKFRPIKKVEGGHLHKLVAALEDL